MSLPLRNVLVFHSAALGDFVVTWPLAVALGRVFPQSRVVYVTAASKGALAERVLGVESADVDGGGWHGLFTDDGGGVPEPARRWLAGAHTVVTFVARPGDAWTRNVRRLAPGADVVHLWTNPHDGSSPHVTAQLTAQLAPWPVIRAAHEQILRSVADRGLAARRSAAPTRGGVLIHPGSGSPSKNWPVARFVEVARALTDVRFVLGEAEIDRMPAGDVRDLERVGEVVRPPTYIDLLDVVLSAGQFLGNDSGPAHLAGIVGVRTTVLFGTPPPHPWCPLGPAVRVVHASGLDGMTPQDVLSALQ